MADSGFVKTIKKKVIDLTGIHLRYENISDLTKFFNRKAKETGLPITDCMDQIFSDQAEFDEFIELITVNETYFFREGKHFDILFNKLLPEILKKQKTVNILSCCTSIGCEAYSLAILCEHYSKSVLPFQYKITALDINRKSLQVIEDGNYSKNYFRAESRKFEEIYLPFVSIKEREYRLSNELKPHISPLQHNIINPVKGEYDIVFFRNAFIYINESKRGSVLENILLSLKEDGFLFAGYSETMLISNPFLELCDDGENTFYFQKKGKKTAVPIPMAKNEDKARKSWNKPKTKSIRRREISLDINAVISILRNHDKPVETTLLNVFNRIPPDEVFIFLSDNYDKIIVSLFYLINTGESDKADKVLDKIICHHEDVLTCFLKGEACYFAGNAEKAFKYFERSIKFDSSFWPSLYRMVMISKKTDFYKWGHYLAKAVRVMEKRAKQGFELFLGGFSIEYYIGVLQKMQF